MTPSSSSTFAISADSPAMTLTSEQRQRLTSVLDEYLASLETGSPLDQARLLEEHADLAGVLRVHFRSLEGLHQLAAGADTALPVVPPRAVDTTGTIGDFELVREVGRGGMGIVYEARQISLNRRVAVKVLPFAAVLNPNQIARFRTEAQAAAQINHPNIVPVFAVGVERGIHYYAMEFVDGQPLDRVIQQLGQNRARQPAGLKTTLNFSPGGHGDTRGVGSALTLQSQLQSIKRHSKEHFEAVARLGVQAAQALHAAHENGIVHRDIKPANLLLDGSGKLWVTDFGLARWQRDATLTRTGDFIGTMRYMSPEQAAGRPALIDHRTDIYSLGATLYELLCLKAAFPDDHSPALLQQVERCEPPPPRHHCPQVPSDLETVILKAMAKGRDDRYTTAQELVDDLRRILEGKPTLARPPSLTDRAGKWLGRHRRVVMASMGVALLAIVGLSTALFLIAREQQAAQQNFLRAERNVARAKRYFQDAREVLDHFGVDLSERLAEVPGAEGVRRELLRKSLEYYEGFAEEAHGDPALRSDLAITYGKIAGLFAQTGSTAQAIAAHEECLALFAELAEQDPSAGNLRSLALAKNNLAMLLSRAGEGQRAKQLFQEAILAQRQLVSRDGRNVQVRSDLAASLSNLGLLQFRQHLKAEAQESYRSAIDLLEELKTLAPAGQEHIHKLALACNNLASTYLDTRPKRAIELHTQALESLARLAVESPDSSTFARDLGLTFNNLAAAYSRIGRVDDAVAHYEQAIELQSRVARQSPSRSLYHNDLALTYNNLGLALNRGARLSESQAAFNNALNVLESLLARYPSDEKLNQTAGSVCNNLGLALEQSAQLDAAAAAFLKAIDYQRVAMAPKSKADEGSSLLDKYSVHHQRISEKLSQPGESAPKLPQPFDQAAR